MTELEKVRKEMLRKVAGEGSTKGNSGAGEDQSHS